MILALTDVLAGVELVAALTDDDLARQDILIWRRQCMSSSVHRNRKRKAFRPLTGKLLDT